MLFRSGGLENYDSSRIASKRDGAFKGGAGTEGGGPVGKGGAEGGHPPGADSRGGNGDGQGGDNSRSPASGKGESGTYDYGAGGVSARAGMMGIKPGGGELAELGSNPAATGETPKLDSLDQLSGSDASSGGSGSSMDPGSHPESIFVQVHGRYSALVKNGRF